jgi:uncharacterized protein
MRGAAGQHREGLGDGNDWRPACGAHGRYYRPRRQHRARMFHGNDRRIRGKGTTVQDPWQKQKDGDFLGKGWAFPPSFDREEQTVTMATAEEDIRQSLYILLYTIPGERVMLPDYGCFLHNHVFDLMGETLITHLKGLIEHAILFFEPRVVLEEIAITIADSGTGRLEIVIDYRIIQTNTRNNMVIPFYLKEGTLVPASLKDPDAVPVAAAR